MFSAVGSELILRAVREGLLLVILVSAPPLLASLAVGNAERYAQIESLAISDGLTGLFTRGYMDERLSEEFTKARHLGWPFSFLLLDIDRFKKINDAHGHRFGDEVLRWLARQVTAQSRDTDFVARYGGEEFVAAMPIPTWPMPLKSPNASVKTPPST